MIELGNPFWGARGAPCLTKQQHIQLQAGSLDQLLPEASAYPSSFLPLQLLPWRREQPGDSQREADPSHAQEAAQAASGRPSGKSSQPGRLRQRQQEWALCTKMSLLWLILSFPCLFRVSFGPLFIFFFLWQLSVFLISKHTCFELGFVFLFWVMGWYCFQLIQSHKYFHHIRTVYTFFYNEVVSLSLTAVREHQREKIGNCSCRHTCMVTI